MLASVGRILAAVHGVGAGAVPAQFSCRVALQDNLIFLSAAVDGPQQNAARSMWMRIAISQPITVGTRLAFSRRSRQGSKNNAACWLMIPIGRNRLHDLFLKYNSSSLTSLIIPGDTTASQGR